jgi:hypothetical protein
MKFAKWVQLFAVMLGSSNLLSAQTAPGLELLKKKCSHNRAFESNQIRPVPLSLDLPQELCLVSGLILL